VAADLDLKHRAREENTGLVFSGYLEIPSPGVYTFHLESDDGADLFVGEPAATCEVVALKRKSVPAVRSLAEALAESASPQWLELEGQVVFAGHNESALELQINARGERWRATVIKSSDSVFPELLHRQIHAAGICRIARDAEQRKTAQVIIPGPDQIEIREPEKDGLARGASSGAAMTTADQVRRLKPEEARKGLSVKITGAIIWTSPTAFVVADSTGGVFTHWMAGERDEQPRVGELWEIAGRTAPGDFSPVILSSAARFLGNAEMPEPIRPTWDQIMNGSLDAQYVEIRGVLTAVSQSEMALLTPDGKLKIRGNTDRPLTRLPGLAPGGAGKFQGEAADPSARRSLIDSVVRLRGCFTAEWDRKTKQVKAGVIYLGAAIIDLEEPPPRDPFSAAARKTADLLRFDARASALQRTKVAGQIIYARPREYYVQDEQTGLRFLTRESLPLRIGDLVEGVGFPQLGGPSPVLQEAQVRKTGSAALPRPVPVSAQDLLDRNLDSTLVRLEAVLVNDAADREERVLELQAGPCHFRARLKSERGSWKSLAPGSRLQLSGVYSSARGEPADENLDPFELLLTNASAITVLQQPPWWTARRAITVVALLAGGMGVSLVWITLLRRQVEERTAQLQKQIEERQAVEQRRIMEQERTRVAQDLHDELGAGLTEVGILGSLAKNPSVPAEERERYLDRLTEAARSLVTGLDEIVWAVNPHYDSVASLASYYSLFAQRFLNLAGIACRLEIAERFPEHPLDSSVRHGIFLAFKEALNNVVRHSEATEVGLRIAVAEDELTIAVKDNGRGLESAPQAPGNDGLAGMRERIAKLGGHCEINSHPGRGTTVEFRLPLPGAQSQTTKPAAPREGVRPA
jgi:signal transduction histidine kinase